MKKLFMIALVAMFSMAMVTPSFAQAPTTEKKADKAAKKADKAEKKAANPCAAKAAEKK